MGLARCQSSRRFAPVHGAALWCHRDRLRATGCRPILHLTLFPARDGDCLLLSYGDGVGGRLRHVLVDGGRPETYASLRPTLKAMSEAGESLELLVLSHIDNDHVGGLLELVADPSLPIPVENVWFNPVNLSTDLEVLGFEEAGDFEAAVRRAGWPLNAGLPDGIVALDGEDPIVRCLDGGLRITILSPERDALARLATSGQAWFRGRRSRHPAFNATTDLETLGRGTHHPSPDVPTLFERRETIDRDPANRSSIALVAEWRGVRVLLAADAHAGSLTRSLRALAEDGLPYRVDLCKVSHHGAKGNTSTDLLRSMRCSRFVFSTDGSGNGHPDPETIARILTVSEAPVKLYFNYRSHNARIWDDPRLEAEYGHVCVFPNEGAPLVIDVGPAPDLPHDAPDGDGPKMQERKPRPG